ncbi:hypothetical protein MGSAQ_002528 [marine sediment metagenome]|uniref:Uncharacterized protein n=1 Tax=marine sediment metagenome TaxID=412755 RepID=A0A1B6NR71_9ZZZZ
MASLPANIDRMGRKVVAKTSTGPRALASSSVRPMLASSCGRR